MKIILLLLSISSAWSVCSSPISRTNNSPNTVLTSTKLNADFNAVYTAANLVDGSCITNGTITAAKLDLTDLALLLKVIKEGCEITRNNASSVDVNKCLIAINGKLVETTGLTNIAFGCGGCSSEVILTAYYVYALGTSTGSTLNLLISTTAPGRSGYNGNDRVLGRFWNDHLSDIGIGSIAEWKTSKFEAFTDWSTPVATVITADNGSTVVKGTIVRDRISWRRIGDSVEVHMDYAQSNTGTVGTGTYLIEIPVKLRVDVTQIDIDTGGPTALGQGTNSIGFGGGSSGGGNNIRAGIVRVFNASHVMVNFTVNDWPWGVQRFGFNGTNARVSFKYLLPIEGWDLN